MTITLITASFIGILLIALSYNVARFRLSTKTEIGTGGSGDLEHAVRAQANLVEYAPIALILIGLLEYRGANYYLLLALGIVLVFARIIHGYGLGIKKGPNKLRFWGTLLTWAVILVASVAGLLSAYKIV